MKTFLEEGMKMKWMVGWLLLSGSMAFASLRVFVSIEPQRFLVEQIGGDRVEVSVMVPQGKNPHGYEPLPSQVKQLGGAAVWFTVGLEFEQVLASRIKKAYPKLRLVDTSEGIQKRTLTEMDVLASEEEHDEHHDEHHDEDTVGAIDPHVWMSLRLAEVQARHIRDTLTNLDRKGAATYQSRYEALVQQLRALDREITKKLAPYQGRVFFIYHPVLGYFARDYGLVQMAIETGGKEPSPALLNTLIQKAKKQGVRVVFVQEGFPRRSAEAVARAIKGRVVEVNPLSPDYVGMFRRISEALVEAWR